MILYLNFACGYLNIACGYLNIVSWDHVFERGGVCNWLLGTHLL